MEGCMGNVQIMSNNAGQILGYCVWQIDNILDSRDSTHCNTPPLQTFELESKN